MPKLKSFSIAGVEMWFWSNDHNPPHFHAKIKGAWEVKVHFLKAPEGGMFEFVWQKQTFLSKHRKALAKHAEGYRFQLHQEWEQKVKIK
jgi:hypothetical protein